MDGAEDQRVAAFSAQLRHAHQLLRDRLGALRDELGSGQAAPTALSALRAHCLAFCAALTTHHRGEDDGLFAALLRGRPTSRPRSPS